MKNLTYDKPEICLNAEECGIKSNEECSWLHGVNGQVGERMCNKRGYWSTSNGHLLIWTHTQPGDTFSFINVPAHIQGTPACFEVSISAFKSISHPPLLKSLMSGGGSGIGSGGGNGSAISSTQDQSLALLVCAIERDATTAFDDIKSLIDSSPHTKHQSDCLGITPKDALLTKEAGGVGDMRVLHKLKNLLCINAMQHESYMHAATSSPPPSSTTPITLCWSCKAPLDSLFQSIDNSEMRRCLLEDQELFGLDILDEASETYRRASLAAFTRGVCIKWLESFTNFHDCWKWPTWRVVANIIKPATAHSRCRYIQLPGITGPAKVGPVDIFVSHSWGGVWGDLVAAALNCIDDDNSDDSSDVCNVPTVRVYIDVFAVRQWPGNINDIVFAGVVKDCKTVMVVVSASELERIGDLNFKDISERYSTGYGQSVVILNIALFILFKNSIDFLYYLFPPSPLPRHLDVLLPKERM